MRVFQIKLEKQQLWVKCRLLLFINGINKFHKFVFATGSLGCNEFTFVMFGRSFSNSVVVPAEEPETSDCWLCLSMIFLVNAQILHQYRKSLLQAVHGVF
jgi:hypothetical protein